MLRSDLSFQQIYNQLLAGQKMVMHFANIADAENFRTRMHHHKAKQEKVLIGLGFQVEDERLVLSFRVQHSRENGSAEVVAYIAFLPPSPLKKYQVIILEPEDLRPQPQASDAQIRKDLGPH